MAISAIAKAFPDGTILLKDGTGTPISVTVQFEDGDFKVSGLQQGELSISKYEDRGVFYSARKTKQVYPQVSFTAHFTDLSDGTNKTLPDAVLKQGAFSGGVSTLVTTAGDVWCLDTVFTVTGTALGDSADHVCTLTKVHWSIDISEGDPSKFSMTGEVLGAITMT